jgi:hypothetical protein
VSVATTVEIRGIDKTKAAFASVNKSMGALKSSVGGLKGAVAGLIGVGGLAALAGQFRATADQIGKVSARLGVGTSDLQKFQIAAEQGGMDISTFNMALQRFTRRTAEAAIGTGEAKDVIAEMGLQLRDNEGNLRSNSDLLLDVSQILSSNLIPQADKVRIAFKLFDSEGAQLINTLQLGPDAIKRIGGAMEDFGVIIDSKTISAAEQLGDRMDMLQKRAMNLFSPVIKLANEALTPFFEKTELAALPLPVLRDRIKETINALEQEKDALNETNKSSSVFTLGARDSAQTVENQRNAIQKQIDTLKEQKKELNAQIDTIRKSKEAQELATKARMLEKSALDDTAIAQENLNARKAHENNLYAQGMTMQDESAAKLREHIEERNRLESEAEDQRIILNMERSEAHRAMLAEELEDARQKAEAEKALTAEVAKSTISTIAGMSATLASESRELFNLNKAASIAMVYINAAEAASKAYAQLGVFGPIAAGTIYALAIANIGKIASQNYPERQAGGDVRPGETYLVGERGPELLTMGQYGGNVTPNRNLAQGVIINIYDGTGRKIDQAMSDLRVEVVERAQQFGEFAALESRQYTQNAFA